MPRGPVARRAGPRPPPVQIRGRGGTHRPRGGEFRPAPGSVPV